MTDKIECNYCDRTAICFRRINNELRPLCIYCKSIVYTYTKEYKIDTDTIDEYIVQTIMNN